MADEQPGTPAPDASAPPAALDAMPLGEFVKQRNAAATGAPPPPAPVAQADGDAGDAAEGADAPSSDPLTDSPAAKGSRTRGELQKRIDTLVRAKSDAERLYQGTTARVEALEQEIARLRNGNGHAPPEPAAPAPPAAEPTLQSFLEEGKTYEDWVEARIEWRIEQRITRERQAAQQAAAQQSFQQAVSGFPQRAEAVRTAHPDFDSVVTQNDSVVLSPVMQDVCLRSPKGAEIMYWLGTHPEVANEIAQMSQAYPPQAFPLIERHLLALAGSAGSPVPTGTGPAVAPVTRAPAPISPVGGGGTQTSRSLDEAPLGEYVARRNAEIARRRGGGR